METGLTDATPARFEEAICMWATFTASAAKVAELLPDARLHPLLLRPGRSLVTLVALEHRLCDFGPFGELSVAAHVRFGRRALPALSAIAQLAHGSFHVHPLDVVVTARSVRAALAERHGFPARVADVSFRQDEAVRECAVSEGGARVLTLGCARPRGARPRRVEVTLYSMQGGGLSSTLLEITRDALGLDLTRGAARLELGGDHPVARRLAALDLDPRPAAVSASPSSRAVLHRPAPAAEDGGRGSLRGGGPGPDGIPRAARR